MGAVTAVIKARNPIGGVAKSCVADVTFSGTYGAGGDTFTPGIFEMTTILGILPLGPAVGSATTGYEVMPDLTGGKLRLLGGAASGVALAETATANQAATVARVLVIGNHPYI
jgi:hypothetical protein